MQTLPTTAHVPVPRPCFGCNGSGRVPNDDEQRYDDCDMCEGSGVRLDPELAERIAA
jgi:hypothetical protein